MTAVASLRAAGDTPEARLGRRDWRLGWLLGGGGFVLVVAGLMWDGVVFHVDTEPWHLLVRVALIGGGLVFAAGLRRLHEGYVTLRDEGRRRLESGWTPGGDEPQP